VAAVGRSNVRERRPYDNTGTDTGEAVETAGLAGTDLARWSLVLYNGSNTSMYTTTLLSGTIPNQQAGFGTLSFSYPTNGLQNGVPDGLDAKVRASCASSPAWRAPPSAIELC
jgi:hypothetical protein